MQICRIDNRKQGDGLSRVKLNSKHTIRQHYIPAAHIGEFSAAEEGRSRKRPVWVIREGREAFDTPAENVGYKKHMYTLHYGDHGQDYIDKTWTHVEKNIVMAVSRLSEHHDAFFDAITWATVLVPFLAQLFVRGFDYERNLMQRAPWFEHVFDDKKSLSDNINLNRIIDFQLNCSLFVDAKWLVLHNYSRTPFILNDIGYGVFENWSLDFKIGYMVPLNKKTLVLISKRSSVDKELTVYRHPTHGQLVRLPAYTIPEDDEIKKINKQLAHYAENELYGAEKDLVEDAWKSKSIGVKQPPINNLLVKHPGRTDYDIVDHFCNFLELLDIGKEDFKQILGGRLVELAKNQKGESIRSFTVKDFD